MSKPTKVHIIGLGTHHKTGTVWMRNIFREMSVKLNIEFMPIHRLKAFHKVPETGRCIVANWSSRFPEDFLNRDDVRTLHIIRDPRDVLLSGARYHEISPGRNERFLHTPKAELKGKSYQQHLQGLSSLPEKLAFEMDGIHARTLHEMISWKYGSATTFEIRYEDLIIDKTGELFDQAMRFLGLPSAERDVSRQIFIEKSLFSRSEKSNNNIKRYTTHVNSGAPRQWVNTLPLETAELYLDKYGDDLITLGYEKDREWIKEIKHNQSDIAEV